MVFANNNAKNVPTSFNQFAEMMESPITILVKPHAIELMLSKMDLVEDAIAKISLWLLFAVAQEELLKILVWLLVQALPLLMEDLVNLEEEVVNTAVRVGTTLCVVKMVRCIKMLVWLDATLRWWIPMVLVWEVLSRLVFITTTE